MRDGGSGMACPGFPCTFSGWEFLSSYEDFEDDMSTFVQESDQKCYKLYKCVDDIVGALGISDVKVRCALFLRFSEGIVLYKIQPQRDN